MKYRWMTIHTNVFIAFLCYWLNFPMMKSNQRQRFINGYCHDKHFIVAFPMTCCCVLLHSITLITSTEDC